MGVLPHMRADIAIHAVSVDMLMLQDKKGDAAAITLSGEPTLAEFVGRIDNAVVSLSAGAHFTSREPA